MTHGHLKGTRHWLDQGLNKITICLGKTDIPPLLLFKFEKDIIFLFFNKGRVRFFGDSPTCQNVWNVLLEIQVNFSNYIFICYCGDIQTKKWKILFHVSTRFICFLCEPNMNHMCLNFIKVFKGSKTGTRAGRSNSFLTCPNVDVCLCSDA